jgi:acetoin utilization deacetylase AcuC-like enzyme
LDGHGKLSYALVRPPGHHAQPTQADGYYFLNNAGLAVQLAVESGCKRVAVVDIDVHYGNGTAEGFYERDDVLTISLHMNHGSWGPSHLQTGLHDEVGRGKGLGFNLNVPLPNGTGDKGYEHAMHELVVPAISKFMPEMILLVIGQDSSAVSSVLFVFCFFACLFRCYYNTVQCEIAQDTAETVKEAFQKMSCIDQPNSSVKGNHHISSSSPG